MMKYIILCLSSFLVMSSLTGQALHGTTSYPIYKQGAKLVNSLDEEGKEIVRIEYDLIFSSKSTFRTLTDDWEYTILGFADDGVKDLDLKIYEYDDLLEEYRMVKMDNSSNSYSVVTIKPEETASYKIEIIVHDFNEGYTAARYGLIVYHD